MTAQRMALMSRFDLDVFINISSYQELNTRTAGGFAVSVSLMSRSDVVFSGEARLCQDSRAALGFCPFAPLSRRTRRLLAV